MVKKFLNLFLILSSLYLGYPQVEASIPPAKKKSTKKPIKRKSTAPVSLIFQLDANILGPHILYPGQRTELQYKISYNRNIDLTKSTLPFIQAEHFIKIGDVKVKDYQKGDLTIQELSQEIEAAKTGRFELGPSFIEGYSYTLKGGDKTYEPSLLKAEAPMVVLEVKPFPEKDKPPSFIGTLGAMKASISLQQTPSISIGDVLLLLISIEGTSNLSDLKLPPIECQPGFGGFFQFPDNPPLSKIEGNKKTFFLEVRPLTQWFQEIPSIELSSFDPLTHKYIIERSKPIPFQLAPESANEIDSSGIKYVEQTIPTEWPKVFIPMIKNQKDFENIARESKPLPFIHYLFFLFGGIFFLFLQNCLHKWMMDRPKTEYLFSKQLLLEAMKEPNESYRQLHLIEKAFWTRLWEKGIVKQGSFTWEFIPEEKNLKLIYSFLNQLQAWQYGPNKDIGPHWKENMKTLFNSLS